MIAITYILCNAFYSLKATESRTIKKLFPTIIAYVLHLQDYIQTAQTQGFRLSIIAIPYILCNAFYSFKATASRTIKKLFPTIFAHVLHLQDYISYCANARISAIYDSYSLQFLQCFVSVKATEGRTIKKLFPTFFAVDIQVIHIQYIRSRII